MRLLLTGSRGMLGSSILARIGQKYEVLSPNRSELDLLDSENVLNYLRENNPNLIIHAAAKVGGIQANIENGFDFLTQNIRIDSNIFSAARSLKISKLIYIGSTCMYPKDREFSLKESDLLTGTLEPTNEGYALAKIIGTKTVELAAETEKLAWRTLILSNLYGPNDHFELDRSHLIAAVIKKVDLALESGSPSISMWGDGTSRREFTFVNDVSEFIVDNLENLKDLPTTMNLGSGVDSSILEFYEIITDLMGYKGKIISDPSKPNGMKRKLSNSTLAAGYGWLPKTTLNEGLAQTIAWYNENKVRFSS
jgi:GDP-L-fucose synthase